MARRGDGLVLRGKTWWLDFTHMGRRYQVRLGRNINKTVARELASVERAKILKGEAGIGSKKRKDMLFDKATEEFLKWAAANKRPKTVKPYRTHAKNLMRSFEGKKLSEIHPFLVEKHKQTRLAAGVPVASNRELTFLNTMFNRLIDWDKFEGANPCRKVKKVEEPLSKLRYLDPEEETRLLKASKEPLRTIILIGIYAGLRIDAEVLTLKWENIDLQRKELTVEAAYSKNKETQVVPINSILADVLKDLAEHKRGEYLFYNRQEKPLKSIRTAFTTACRNANLAGVTPHTLRHTFASRLGMSGANDRTLQALGRWKEPKMIQRYTHLSQQHLAEAVEKIARYSTTLFTTRKTQSV